MVDYDKLEALAKAALVPFERRHDSWVDFREAVDPATVLALLSSARKSEKEIKRLREKLAGHGALQRENERLKATNKTLKEQTVQACKAAKRSDDYANSVANENERLRYGTKLTTCLKPRCSMCNSLHVDPCDDCRDADNQRRIVEE